MTAITAFSGRFRWLSNFHPAPIVLFSTRYPTVEHAFQAAKTFDVDARQAVAGAADPATARRLGRQVPLRTDWEDVKDQVMLLALRAKFTQHRDLAARLVGTGDAHLEEGNRHGDRYWGTVDGHGVNRLGQLMMQVRRELAVWSGTGR